MSVSKRAMRNFVDRTLTVRLATVSAKGTPMVTPLWYARDGDVIYMGTRRGSIHARHMTENPRVVMLFGDRNVRRTKRVLKVIGTARVCEYETMSSARKARLAWRYFFQPEALWHWLKNWRKLGVRNRYYAERTDPAMVEITLEDAEFVPQPAA
jgi:nitroimidazol reductase NimA-like FMN-containing flavoprotein (pyridoxamine 5'-phosphate oxidase superfamily)